MPLQRPTKTNPTEPVEMDGSNFTEGEMVEVIQGQARVYLNVRSLEETSKARADRAKATIKKLVDEHGEVPDAENGSRFFYLSEPVPYTTVKDGKPVSKPVKGFKVEHRSSEILDVEAAEALCKKLGIWDDVTEVVPEHRELSEDLLLAARFEDQIDDDAFKALYSTVPQTPAFKLIH